MSNILSIPKNLIKKFSKANKTLNTVKIGEGAVIESNGKKIAVYKESESKTIAISPTCTHMGCQVDWNNKEKTWDCPCHGTKYSKEGTVIKGPATKNLEKVSL